MLIQFGDVVAANDQGATIRLGDGRELWVSGSELAQLGVTGLPPGARVRAVLEGDSVQNMVAISGIKKPEPESEARISARITSIDRRVGVLSLKTQTGEARFGPVMLSEEQWARLAVGTEVTVLRSAQGKHRLELPQPDRDGKPTVQPQNMLVVTIQGSGTIAQVGPYHVVVDGVDGQQYGFMRSKFPGSAFYEGDQVTFRAIKESYEIVDISLLERKVPGFGGRNPCDGLLMELMERTDRKALTELAQHFCADKRLEWYWITPRQEAQEVPVSDQLDPRVIEAIRLAVPNFNAFFKHQATALDALNIGRHVLVLTPTASGKTYCYNPAVFQFLQGDPTARALYVFPLNALLVDQVDKLQSMANAFREQGTDISVDRLIGGLGKERRDHIQEHPPQILATNPEMLSWVLNGNAYRGWPDFLRRLRFVVLDEVHTYRSLLGLHMAGLIRRLLVACRRYGNPNPQFVLSSATVGAPEELATRLTSLPLDEFQIIGEDEDGSEQQQRHWMMLTPYADVQTNLHNMHLHQAAVTLVDVLTVPTEDLNAILFAKSIRDVRFVYRAVQQLLTERQREDLKPEVTSFASALLTNEEKRIIYRGLHDGSLRAVVSTNALEAGIDIGNLDVCIIAGFPFHVMRMRQMAGRAGRRSEGAVIFIPHPMHVVDKFYRENPKRLLTQPPESFVIDHENPYIARKHVVACAASMAGGVQHQELELFGKNLDRIIREAREHKALDVVNTSVYTARRRRGKNDPWAIGNMRSAEQDPYVICKAPPDKQRVCSTEGCTEFSKGAKSEDGRCSYLVQLIDRQYVYREAHPGAVFEDRDGHLYEVEEFDDRQKLVWVKPLPENTMRRTFADENTNVTIGKERGRRELSGGAILVWGDVLITREYSGFFEYDLIPRRRCPRCRRDYAMTVASCPSCKRRTRPYLASSRPKYHDFPGRYQEVAYSIKLETIACWLILPATLETQLAAVSRCRIPGRKNRVAQFLQTAPPFSDPADLASVVGLSTAEAEPVFEYFDQRRRVFSSSPTVRRPKNTIPVYPAFYGQCLRHHLRQHLPEDQALAVFAQVTGYPVLTDERHVCRNCVGSVLLPAAHTLNHLVALRYPTVALGDSQDLGFTTYVLHSQTQGTTVFWYDNYDGGIGAAEKIFDKFDVLLHEALESLDCECRSDEGCPLCTQTFQCGRRNEALSKTAVRGLIHQLLNLPPYVPTDPLYWTESEAREREQESETHEQAPGPVRMPSEPASPPADPFRLLHVQHHVHDEVLRKALEVRGEEIVAETPPVSIQELQTAYQSVLKYPRPTDWRFPPEWTEYQVLHVDQEASKHLAHMAYKIIVLNVHPDRNRKRVAWATEVTKRVNAAWEAVQRHWIRPDSERAVDRESK